MISIQYENETTIENVDPALTLLEISLKNNIPHVHACGGHARCSTCRVAVVKNLENCAERNAAESKLAIAKGLDRNIRLACQTRLTGPVTIRRLVIDDEDLREASETASSGQEKQLAILFSDIRSFTPFAENNLPYDVVHVMNRYFRRMGDAIQRFDGYIDKYIGDGMMALFGIGGAGEGGADATVSKARAQNARTICRNAVLSALDMQRELTEVNRYLRHTLGHEFRIGIGIHFGEVIVGAIGHPDKRQFTALGDNVNIASRIESITKKAGVPLLISQEVYSQLESDLTVHQRFRTRLRGKSGDFHLFSVTAIRTHEVEQLASSASGASVVRAARFTPSSTQQERSFDLQILEVRKVADKTLALLLDTSSVEDFRFISGQHITVTIPRVKLARTFSIASAARIRGSILIATRIRDSEYKQHMERLVPGDVLSVSAPEGVFTLPADPARPIVFIAGGIGITPIHSMIQEMVQEQPNRPILLFYANRSPEASAFAAELELWIGAMPHGRMVRIFSRAQVAGAEHGRLSVPLIHKHLTAFEALLRNTDRTYQPPLHYVVGPEAMTLDTVRLLEKEGVSRDLIILEAFYGY